jgi:cyclopropane fatty-acyl-phospholipid synthase-like methyltransferase
MNKNGFIDAEYTYAFHSPGEEPWICGLLKSRRITKVLDLGCGSGFWGFILRTYAASNANIVGVDISTESLKRLKNLGIYDELILGDATSLDLDGTFDAILAIEFFHQLADKETFLRGIEEKLAKNGVLIISGPSTLEMRKILHKRNYSVYEYFLRGLILSDTKTGELVVTYPSKTTLILASLLRLGRIFAKSPKNVHIIAFKEAS